MSEITLYFAQHGLAVDKAEDPTRPLSETGKTQTKNIAYSLRDNAIPVNHIFHSGKLRAAQTAEIFAAVLRLDVLQPDSITAVDYLSPNEDVIQTAQHLKINNALYIGHLPHLEKLVAYLICGDKNINIVKFSNSAVVCLHKSGDKSLLHWHLPPELVVI